MSKLILPRTMKRRGETPREWAKRWGIAARFTGTPEPGSGVGLMTEQEIHDLFSHPDARAALEMVEEHVFDAPTTIGVALRCLHKETVAERNQEAALDLYDHKREENADLYKDKGNV